MSDCAWFWFHTSRFMFFPSWSSSIESYHLINTSIADAEGGQMRQKVIAHEEAHEDLLKSSVGSVRKIISEAGAKSSTHLSQALAPFKSQWYHQSEKEWDLMYWERERESTSQSCMAMLEASSPQALQTEATSTDLGMAIWEILPSRVSTNGYRWMPRCLCCFKAAA